MQTFSFISTILAALFAILCGYQLVYAAVKLLGGKRRYPEAEPGRYAVLIAARNEQAVLGPLLDSIRAQDYPRERLDIFVVADNCTDSTALVAAAHGATVFQRFDRQRVGKGYALQFLLEKLWSACPAGEYDGYFVFDADNLLDPGYIREMNKVFAAGNRVVTGYRGVKNFGDNWLTAGYGLYFLRESEYMNRPRDLLGVSCMVSGTGFLVADSLLRETGGWRWFSLSEDTEFTADMLCRGERIAYCPDAVLYDEQPRDFRVSVTQRSRWIKGYLQVLRRRGTEVLRACTVGGRLPCWELLFGGVSLTLCGAAGFLVNALAFLTALCASPQTLEAFLRPAVETGLLGGAGSFLCLYLTGLVTLLTEWKRIRCPGRKKLLYSLGYPVFMATFALAVAPALFGRAQWKPVAHTAALTVGEVCGPGGKIA